MSMQSESYWHLDKRIPLAMIAAIIIQTVGVTWWAATLTERVDDLRAQVTQLQGFAADRYTQTEASRDWRRADGEINEITKRLRSLEMQIIELKHREDK
ncbi:MAG: hypothetical protein AAGE89_12565 [Pseudomonadota bacterium]